MATQERTVRDWLVDLGKTNKSTDEDAAMMQQVLRRIGFPEAVVTCGIVYFDGKGENVDIHSMARTMVREMRLDYGS